MKKNSVQILITLFIQKSSMLLIWIFLSLFSTAQNLVPNGDFEDYYGCPINGLILDSVLFWNSPTFATPDFVHDCGNEVNGGIGSTVPKYQRPQSGKGYGGFISFIYKNGNDSHRSNMYSEYFQTSLTDSLVENETYEVSFYLNLANFSQYAAPIGIYFSKDSMFHKTYEYLFDLSPQLVFDSLVTDTVNWIRFRTCYVAEGGEQYMMIGGFDSSLNIKQLIYPEALNSMAYYYIDNISVSNGAFTFSPIDPICATDSITLSATMTDSASYLWQDGSTTDTFLVTDSGTYWVEISSFCAISRDSIDIDIIPITVLPENGGVESFCPEDSVQLTADTIENAFYVWSTGDTAIQITVDEQGDYFLTTTLPCQSAIDTFRTILKNKNICDCLAFVPNSFSPNRDDINDQFGLTALNCNIKQFSLKIYDRFGKLVFQTDNPNQRWDGTFKENSVNTGVYVYVLKLTFEDIGGSNSSNYMSKKGNITLVR